MQESCGDNRFRIIERAKKDLLESTNIETREDEMRALDSFLFRCWQMGWLDKYDYEKRQSKRTAERMIDELLYDNDINISVSGYESAVKTLSEKLEQAIYYLGVEYFTDEVIQAFCCGEDIEINEILDKNPVLRPANEYLNWLFENASGL